MFDEKTEAHHLDWAKKEEVAEAMIPLIGKLYRDHGVVSTIFGRSVVHCSAIDIVKAHRFARRLIKQELSVFSTWVILQAMGRLDLTPARIDIGKLTVRFHDSKESLDIDAFMKRELGEIFGTRKTVLDRPQDLVLYGFGRIGRILARILIERAGGGDKWRLRAVVVRKGGQSDLVKRASLLRRDSVHGQFDGTITLDEQENALVANGNLIRFLYADDPSGVDYAKYGIENAIVLDNTGVWNDREGLSRHLASDGVSKVVLTAPGKGDVPNIVYGVNNDCILDNERVLSACSCTTNAMVPVIKVINDRFGIESGHIETCHSYTNDQNLIDNFHRNDRRGRAAPLNMVITDTGAARAVAKVLPEMEGKLTANAIRVPTPNVSLAILNLTMSEDVTVAQVNGHLRDLSLDSTLSGQLDFVSSSEVVSSDFVGTEKTSIVDSLATIVHGRRCVLYVWYDNEYGYSAQVVRIVQHVAGLELPSYPK